MSKPTQDSMYKVSGKYFYALLPEVGDSSHMTGKFKDLWFAWLNKENDSTWLGLEIQWLETWLDLTFMNRQDLTL